MPRRRPSPGTCKDKAANTSPPATFELRYDTKPPVLGRVKAELRTAGAVIRWTASKDAYEFVVLRRPGLKGPKPSTVYSGKSRAFTDRRRERASSTVLDRGVRRGRERRREGTHRSDRTGTTRPTPTTEPTDRPASPARPALTRPAAGARVAAPPVLDWTAVPKATYYNVQLYRDGKKILTVGRARRRTASRSSWTFDGRRHRLSPGRYTLVRLAGARAASANRYGKLNGSRTFVVTG